MGRADLNLTSAMFERRSSLQRTMMMMVVVVMMMMTTMATTVEGETCPDPAPSATFTYEAFEGTWYEVGKYQVDNPFEKGCECDELRQERKGGERDCDADSVSEWAAWGV